jgi:hypothetical protein
VGRGGTRKMRFIEKILDKSIVSMSLIIKVTRNKWGNYEHIKTGFLFDRKTKEVYGRQMPDGSISAMSDKDIIACYNMGLKCKISSINIQGNCEQG